ncbi:hypothetical protein H2O64_23255 [Kordia sp. YSTF-M3]|uniref:Bacteriocin n=1 Tax=Kordia aestuariivivens TaxID=2759037 RepID=A0ABR7QGA1_9FLAO|nr:class I lanthipeptide [Kordia aestuariivivens]MBC8757605.1 hypothetical protein [Kordia aestuariivivens]
MKKQKLGLNKLSLTKSRIAELNTSNVVGGTRRRETTNPQCIITGIYDGCEVTANECQTNIACTNNNCGGGSGTTTDQTQQFISCYEAC